MTMPLLIGGATTSRPHTAVKIAPEYTSSRSCTCSMRRARWTSCRSLLSATNRGRLRSARSSADQERLRQQHAALKRRPLLTWPDGQRETGSSCDWTADAISPCPSFTGAQLLDDARSKSRAVHRLDVLLLRVGAEGTLPRHPRPPAVRRGRARALRPRAHGCSIASSAERLLTLRGVYGFWPAQYRWRRHRAVPNHRRARAPSLQHAAAAGAESRRQAEPLAGRFHRADGERHRATTSARSP